MNWLDLCRSAVADVKTDAAAAQGWLTRNRVWLIALGLAVVAGAVLAWVA